MTLYKAMILKCADLNVKHSSLSDKPENGKRKEKKFSMDNIGL